MRPGHQLRQLHPTSVRNTQKRSRWSKLAAVLVAHIPLALPVNTSGSDLLPPATPSMVQRSSLADREAVAWIVQFSSSRTEPAHLPA